MLSAVIFYNTEQRQYHGMAVNYYNKKAYNIGPGLNVMKVYHSHLLHFPSYYCCNVL
jgi:hypothetical protein